MNAAFIGNRHDIEIYAKIFKDTFSANCEQRIRICGVLSGTLESTTNLAINLNVKAYLNINDLLKECDVLFICYRDEVLKNFAAILKRMRVRNKILCHFCPSLLSSDIGTNVSNSYYAISFPYVCGYDKTTDCTQIPILIEHSGAHCEEFERIIKDNFQNSEFCIPTVRAMCHMANRIVKTYMKLCLRAGRFLYKSAGMYHAKWFELLVISSLKEEFLYPDEYKLKSVNLSHIKQLGDFMSETEHPYLAEYIRTNENLLLGEDDIPDTEKKALQKILKSPKKIKNPSAS